MKALNKDPKHRYERIQQFAQELEQACQSGPSVRNFSTPSPNISYANAASAGLENAPAISQPYGQFNANSTQAMPQFPTQQPPYAGTSNAQVQLPGQPFQPYPGPHAYQQNQTYPFASQQYAQSTNQQPYPPIHPAQQQGQLDQATPYAAERAFSPPEPPYNQLEVPAASRRQGVASPEASESAGRESGHAR